MTLALHEPDMIANIIAVDNAPVDARLGSDFARYIQGMKKIDEANITRQAEADKILEEYEKVNLTTLTSIPIQCTLGTSTYLVSKNTNTSTPGYNKTKQSLTIRQFLLGNLHRPSPDSKTQKFRVPLHILGKALDHMGDFPFKNPGEARFAKPALFVRGTRSTYVPDEVVPLIGQFFPMFELVDIEAGHWVISEKPEEFRQGELHTDKLILILNF
jgi:pimeloyl-ACP methyl ester carboxylesterase